MDIQVKPGKYVVAVSGGVDSMVLLHLLARRPGLELVVAHFDHGIRPDSGMDRQLVEAEARRLGLACVCEEGRLGPQASEATARQARYDFLRRVRDEQGARAIVTAHHQDDVLETAIINLLRGTNRRGLSSLTSTPEILRPLLDVRKQDILDYAIRHNVRWHEDSTNADDRYLRNYVRHRLLGKCTDRQRSRLLQIVADMRRLNAELDRLVAAQLQGRQSGIDRTWFAGLPHAVAREIMAGWLRQHNVANVDAAAVERLVVTAKVGRPGSRTDATGGWFMTVQRHDLALKAAER